MSATVQKIFQLQKKYFKSGATRDLSFRISQLNKLKTAIQSAEQKLYGALCDDFGKAYFETYATEIGLVLDEISFHIRHLRRWMKRKRVRTPLVHFPSRSWIQSEPYGVTLIIGAWNYPFQLTMEPLIGAISAGNCAIIKPSEISGKASQIIGEIINNTFPPEYLHVIEGGVEITQSLLDLPVDYIFFTGSSRVGKIIMAAAAQQLIPLTLELGGKSPTIVHADANIDLAARRIAWGKFVNAGQTCIAPDYIYAHKDIKDQLLQAITKWIRNHYPDLNLSEITQNACEVADFPRIINAQHFHRLRNLIPAEKVFLGGNSNEAHNYLSPTILRDVTWDDRIMQEEIFGPILPILEYADIEDVISEVNSRPKPLALYLFTRNKRIEHRVLDQISFGGGAINDTLSHIANPWLPFGGVGQSGMGKYHGKASFDTFSNQKSILKKANWLDLPIRYPPYQSTWKTKILKWVLK